MVRLGLDTVSLVKVVLISSMKRVFKILRIHLFVFIIYFNLFLFVALSVCLLHYYE